jgi:hypothetical protein
MPVTPSLAGHSSSGTMLAATAMVSVPLVSTGRHWTAQSMSEFTRHLILEVSNPDLRKTPVLQQYPTHAVYSQQRLTAQNPWPFWVVGQRSDFVPWSGQ